MDCAICYEKFFINKKEEELDKIFEDAVMKNDYNELTRLNYLIITPHHNTTHICSTPNCECIICHNCWFKITHKGKGMFEATDDDAPNMYDKFICPYCRNVDWKDYMNNVFHELRVKLLTREEMVNDMCHYT